MQRLTWLALAVTLGLAEARTARADEEKVPLDKVPKEVMDAVKGRFPGAKLLGASKEKEDGKTVYEISLTYKNHHHDVTVQPDGKVLGIERELPAKDLPKAVAEALAAKYPKATYKTVEELLKGDGKLKGYEVLLVTAEKKTLEVVLDPDGKVLKEEKKGKKDDD
ncbi:MAG: PepSY-like domain-containing protein [Planctomycetes bacterium]|nr:PepSY-like domain-containing protein [Planctomycetota bacterium]